MNKKSPAIIDKGMKVIFILLLFLQISIFENNDRIYGQQKKTVNYNNYLFTQVLEDLPVGIGGGFVKDAEGFIWIGSLQGLIKWDGKQSKIYTPSNSELKSGFINSLYIDKEGILWIATSGGGLSCYDKKTNSFTSYQHNPLDASTISTDEIGSGYSQYLIDEDNDGYLWIGTLNKGLNRLNKKTGEIKRYGFDPNNTESINSNRIFSICVDEQGVLWLSTDNGICSYNKKTDSFTRYNLDSSDKNNPANINTIIREDSEGMLWIGTNNGFLFSLNKGRDKITKIPIIVKGKKFNQDIISIAEDVHGKLWLAHGTNTITIFDKITKKSIQIKSHESLSYSLRGKEIKAVYAEKSGNISITSLEGKINRYDPEAYKFKLYQHNPNNINSIPSNNITRIFKDRKGTLWFDSYDTGFFRYNEETDDFTRISIPGIGHNAMLEDSDGVIWIGTNFFGEQENGLYVFDRKTLQFTEKYSTKNIGFATDIVEDPLDKSILWFTTFNAGLGKFDKKTKQFTYYNHNPVNPESISSNSVWELVVDIFDPNILWLAVYPDGLMQFNTQTQKFKKFPHDPNNPNSISGNDMYSIVQLKNGDIWIMTAGTGLNKYNRKTGTFTVFTEKNKTFIHDSAINVIEDDFGKLWIGGIGKIIKFDPITYKSEIYDNEDGVQLGVNCGGAILKANDGKIWLGGGGGLNSFYPNEIHYSDYDPHVYLTSITQNSISYTKNTSPELLSELRLSWKKNFFEFEATSLDFTNSDNLEYKYKLEGFDNDWYYAGKNNQGRYSGLRAGSYILRVNGTNRDGIWSSKELALKVYVYPPFWRTWWAYLIYIILLGFVVYGMIEFQLYTVKKNNQNLDIIVKQRTLSLERATDKLKRSNEDLLSFAYIVSHDLKAPLRGISQLIAWIDEDDNKNLSKESKENMLLVIDRISKMNDLIDGILKYSRVGRENEDAEEVNIYEIISSTVELLSIPDNIKLIVEENLPTIKIVKTQISQVFMNLINNAIKYMSCNSVNKESVIEIGYKKLSYHHEFFVKDNGIGIEKKYHEKIFGMFQKLETSGNKGGSGIGLAVVKKIIEINNGEIWVESALNSGSTFYFKLPK